MTGPDRIVKGLLAAVFAAGLALPRTWSEWGFVLVCAAFWPFALIVFGVGFMSGDMG